MRKLRCMAGYAAQMELGLPERDWDYKHVAPDGAGEIEIEDLAHALGLGRLDPDLGVVAEAI